MLAQSITDLIGNTPLLKIPSEVHGLKNIEVYAKLELLNPWGSVKDRTAWGILKPHLDELNDKLVIESSSGNTAKALQMIASLHGSSLKTITNRIKVPEAKDVLKLIGTQIQELPGKSDCYDPNDPNDPIVYIQQEIAKDPEKYIYGDQYFNDLNRKIHYDTTGKEIIDDLGKVDYFIGGLGTTGSTLGAAQRVKEHNPELVAIGVVAEKEDYIPGIRNHDETLEVGLFNPEFYSEIVTVNSHDSLEAMMKLIKGSGLLAGPTTGASFLGALKYLKEVDDTLTETKKAVFIACDRVEWYTSYIKDRKPEWLGEAHSESWKDDVRPNAETDVSADRATQWIDDNQPLVIDLRQPISFKMAHIPESINMPYDQLDPMLNTTNPFSTKQKLLFVCPLGEKSSLVANYLAGKNAQAFSLQGGINAWRDQNLSLERDL
ncbi:MAG: Cysteine synthase B [candidate division WS2 bacterium]|nr:Cysteine synthase B [Candidatus Lithacetigena glycinireducens]MBT9175160.1 Cysteine synthase B [Candidatus Lithacetigena glycinireducens]